jgi:hypothetical protein
MTRTIAILIAVLVLVTTATGVFAQEEDWLRIPYKVSIAVDIGIGMPMDPSTFNNLWNSAIPASISIGYLVIPQVEIQGWLTYTSWGISTIPAQNEIGIVGVYEISGGTITTLFYGAAAKYYPIPNSRIMPTVTIGGGLFSATAEDLVVDTAPQLVNSMDDSDGPVLLIGLGMEYAVNERWNVYSEFKYLRGFSDTFAPANLLLGPNEVPVAGEALAVGIINLGILLKL